jgi:hypothetical protein
LTSLRKCSAGLDVLAALAQRQRDGEHVEPVVEILAQLDSFTARCRSRLLAAISRTSTGSASNREADEGAGLGTAELHLRLDRHLDPRREEGAVIHPQGRGHGRSVKAPFSWPNSSLSMRLGCNARVHREERLLPSLAQEMDRLGDQLLASHRSPVMRTLAEVGATRSMRS